MEHFYTIQGEGYHQGKAAYFVRLGGCDVGCVWCDVKESWDASIHPAWTASEIVREIRQSDAKIVVITGGEPLLHQLDTLTQLIQEAGIATHIETSGSSELSGKWDWICVSPKKFKEPLDSVVAKANELKIVVFNNSDFDWAEKWAAKVGKGCRLYLQPEWEQSAKMLPRIVEYVKKHPEWEISLQIHKYLQIP